MKPWLFDILACPIDKNYPLELYIFNYENQDYEIESFLKLYKEKDLKKISEEELIQIIEEEGKIYIQDNLVIEKKLWFEYLNLLIKSLNELDHIYDKSPYNITKECLNIAKDKIKPKILEFLSKKSEDNINEILPDLYLLNKIKLQLEIKSGLLFCPRCKRWYPIIECIPQMLPDEYRNQTEEIKFLKNNKNLLDQEFLKQDLKPFNI